MRTRLMKRAFAALAVLAATGMAAPAHAVFIDTWAYTFSSSFSNVADNGGAGTIVNTGTEIDWGAIGGPRSSIGAVDTPSAGFVDTNGDPVAVDDYFHDNNVLPLGSRMLTSTTLSIDIALTPSDPAAGAPGPVLSRSFDIGFFETPNRGSNGVCADGGAVGTGINANGCADIFTLAFDLGQFDFTYDGVEYSLFLFEDPQSAGFPQLGTLPDAACESVSLDLGCFGLRTPENELTVAEFVISIEAQEVSEPAALGLFGLGLLGLGTLRRRKG